MTTVSIEQQWFHHANDVPAPVGTRPMFTPQGDIRYVEHPVDVTLKGQWVDDDGEESKKIKDARSLVTEFALKPSTKGGRAKLVALLQIEKGYGEKMAEEIANDPKVKSRSQYWGVHDGEVIYPVLTANDWHPIPMVPVELTHEEKFLVREVLQLVQRFNINPNEAHNYRGESTPQKVISAATRALYEDPFMHFEYADTFKFVYCHDLVCPRGGRPDRYGYRCCGPLDEHYKVIIDRGVNYVT